MNEIKGYRVLSAKELELINEGKELAEKVGEYVHKLKTHEDPTGQVDQRWVALGRTHLQEGFMALTRAVANPTTF